ncbi:uncharacterized protein ACN427_000438 [Glossina fuscipes fuscipes]
MNASFLQYSRGSLLLIGKYITTTKVKRGNHSPIIIDCCVIELEARLKRLKIWRSSDYMISQNLVSLYLFKVDKCLLYYFKDPAIISNVPLVADVYNLISGPIFIIWHLNIIITTIQQRRNSDLVSTDRTESEEKSSFKHG